MKTVVSLVCQYCRKESQAFSFDHTSIDDTDPNSHMKYKEDIQKMIDSGERPDADRVDIGLPSICPTCLKELPDTICTIKRINLDDLNGIGEAAEDLLEMLKSINPKTIN